MSCRGRASSVVRLHRLPDWRARLDAYLAACAWRPYAPGRHDCALFAAGAIEAMTGLDFARAYRGAYVSVEVGEALLGRDIATHASSILPELPAVLDAVEGDIAVIDGALGVVGGAHVLVLRPQGGLGTVPLTRADRVLAV